MSEEAFISAVQDFSVTMINLNQNFGTSQITPFDWDPKVFKRWIKAVEKHALLERVPEEKVKLIAFKASSGAVSDFIHIYLKGDPGVSWDALKTELSQRFADVTDTQHAFMLLRRVKQENNENVQIYAGRLLSLAEQAHGVTEIQLVGFFIDGLNSDRLKLKVMRDNPTTMAEAICSARQEFNLQQRFQLRTGRNYFAPRNDSGKPMEIDHYRVKRERQPRNQHKQEHKPRIFDKPKVVHKKVLAIDQNRPRSEIICWDCHKRGLYSFECPGKQVASIEAGENENLKELN